MSVRRTFVSTTLVLAVAVLGGCSATQPGTTPAAPAAPSLGAPTSTSATPSTTATQPTTDYRRLLLTADDVSDRDDVFTAREQQPEPNDAAGASAFFVNEKDTRAISDTITVYSDAAAATASLKQASATLPALVAGGKPTPFPVGADAVLIRGKHPQEAKDVTLLFFTEGRALVRLEFQSAIGDATTDRFVASIGKMQRIALRIGLDEAK